MSATQHHLSPVNSIRTWTRHAISYRRAQKQTRPDILRRLVQQLPAVHQAVTIHQGNAWQRVELEARLLAGQTPQEIAERLAMTVAAIDAYEALFYSVRDCLAAHDYIAAHALSSQADDPVSGQALAAIVRSLAYQSGPLILDLVMPVCRDPRGVLRDGSIGDLHTSHGRQELRARLLVMAHPLHVGGPSGEELTRTWDLIGEIEQQEADQARLEAHWRHEVDGSLAELTWPLAPSSPPEIQSGQARQDQEAA